MKKIKKGFCAAIAIMAVFCFIACSDERQSITGSMTLVVGTETPIAYTVDLDDVEITEGVLSILDYLSDTRDLEYTAEKSVYGVCLTKVGMLEQNLTAGSYIYIYTSVESDFDVSAYATSVKYDGQILVSSGLGVSEMTIEKNCVIYIGIIAF